MSNNVYFGNSVADTVSVNVNDALQNLVLDPRATTKTDDKVTAINCTAVQCPTGPNKDKGKFGTGGDQVNKITIQFENLQSGNQTYDVETKNLSGRDLYIYVFDGTLVGQDETGRNLGITITPVS
jgi:hypothetical protein